MMLQGTVRDYDGRTLTITAPFSDTAGFVRRKYAACEIRLEDGRRITTDQRKKIYATLRDLSDYTGHEPEYLKELMKYSFLSETGGEWFSLSDCDMSTARDYLEYLIEFCVQWDVPCGESLAERAPDVARYLDGKRRTWAQVAAELKRGPLYAEPLRQLVSRFLRKL